MRQAKRLVSVSVAAVAALLLAGCGLPAGQAGLTAGAESRKAAESITHATDALWGDNPDAMGAKMREEVLEEFQPATEATVETAEEFLYYYLYYSTEASVMEASSVALSTAVDTGAVTDSAQLVELDPLTPLVDYSGVPEEARGYYALYSLSNTESYLTVVSPDDLFHVPYGYTAVLDESDGVFRAYANSEVIFFITFAGDSANLEGFPYYMIFTDEGWKIDAERMMTAIM